MLLFSELKKRNLLSNESMSNVRGGVDPWWGTCGFVGPDGVTSQCGVSKAIATHMAAGGGHWCCDSCGRTSYCGQAQFHVMQD